MHSLFVPISASYRSSTEIIYYQACSKKCNSKALIRKGLRRVYLVFGRICLNNFQSNIRANPTGASHAYVMMHLKVIELHLEVRRLCRCSAYMQAQCSKPASAAQKSVLEPASCQPRWRAPSTGLEVDRNPRQDAIYDVPSWRLLTAFPQLSSPEPNLAV